MAELKTLRETAKLYSFGRDLLTERIDYGLISKKEEMLRGLEARRYGLSRAEDILPTESGRRAMRPVDYENKIYSSGNFDNQVEEARMKIHNEILAGLFGVTRVALDEVNEDEMKIFRYMPATKGTLSIAGRDYYITDGMLFASGEENINAIKEHKLFKDGLIYEFNYEKDKDFFDNLPESKRVAYLTRPEFKKIIMYSAAEIQADFRASSIYALQRAKDILKTYSNNKDLIELQKLAALGFENSKEVKAELELIRTLEKATHEAKVMEHYAKYYPQNNFVTDYDVERLCKKYGLVVGEPHRFTGSIPERNRKEILNFSIRKQDQSGKSRAYEIIAPKDLFNYRENWDSMIDGHIMVDDPIVTIKVKHGRLMITAWGYEATLPEVQNPNKN